MFECRVNYWQTRSQAAPARANSLQSVLQGGTAKSALPWKIPGREGQAHQAPAQTWEHSTERQLDSCVTARNSVCQPQTQLPQASKTSCGNKETPVEDTETLEKNDQQTEKQTEKQTKKPTKQHRKQQQNQKK